LNVVTRATLMHVPIAFNSARGRSRGKVLADLLVEEGPLALDLCLRYATELATILREMHQEGRAHGAVDPSNVVIQSSAASLLPAERRGYTDPLLDLVGFGAVLYAMLTGKKPSGEEFRLVPAKPSVLKGQTAVRASAIRLAERCLTAERETAPDLQKVLTEVRLLNVMSKQFHAEKQGIHIAMPEAPPQVNFPPPQALEVYAGNAPPVILPPVGGIAAVLEPQVKTDPAKPGEHSALTHRAKGSHSRPVLQDVVCPKCKGFHVRLSRPRTAFERCLNALGMGVHRCHRCFYRYIPFFGRKIVRKTK
jgi:hypothetical protein